MAANSLLLASLNMDAILAEATIHQRRQVLHRMTAGLGLQDAYDTTLDRIRQQGRSKSKLGMEALMWVSHSERPLKLEELCHALGVELGAEDFNMRNVPSIRAVLGCTLGLVAVDKKESTVRLLHFTLQEYLRQYSTPFVTPHSMMAEICLTYLNCRLIRALPPYLDKTPATTPFLEYATCFWGTYAARGVTEPVKSLALRLLDGYDNHISATVLWRRRMREWEWMEDVRGISGLHCIAFWGIAEIVTAMLERKAWDVNGRDSRGQPPLMWAIEYNNKGTAELFLKQEGIEPDTITKGGRTIFSFAAELGNKDAVVLLLKHRDVNPDSADGNGRTPLSFAAERGREGVVKLLLERGDVGPDSPDRNGRTPLSFAAERGWEGVVKLFLEHGDVGPDLPDRNGRTPLSFATREGQESVVKLLLERGDVGPDSTDSCNRTPLSFAAERGREGVVKLLLERGDVSPDSPDRDARTPLSFAAGEGQEGVLKLLLERGDVGPDSPDRNGRTPLSFATERGQEGVVKLLLERGDVDPNLPESEGRTPLWLSAQRGQEGVVNLLLARSDVDPNSSDGNGRTPLWFAVWTGHEGIVKLLLARGDVDPNLQSGSGQTPLSLVAEKLWICYNSLGSNNSSPFSTWQYECIIKLLLKRRDVNPNSPDGNGRTPLSFATNEPWSPNYSGGNKSVLELLLERGEIDPNFPDSNGRAPLSFAAESGNVHLVKLLLEREDLNPNLSDYNGQTPLSFAVMRGREDVVKLLLQRGDINPNSPDINVQKPLSYASMRGQAEIMRPFSDSRTLSRKFSEHRDRMPISAMYNDTSFRQATRPPTADKPATFHPVWGPPPDASISGSVLSGFPLGQPLPLKQFPPDQFHSPPAPSVPISAPGSSSAIPFFLRPLSCLFSCFSRS